MCSGLLDRVRLAFGTSSVARLVTAFGGRRLNVPARPTGRLETAIGADLAHWLCDHHGGTRLYVPTGATKRDVTSFERVMGMTVDGKSAAEIAAELGICERTVHRQRQRALKVALRHPSIKPIPIAPTVSRRDPETFPTRHPLVSTLVH